MQKEIEKFAQEDILLHLRRCALFDRIDIKSETLSRAADEIQSLRSKLDALMSAPPEAADELIAMQNGIIKDLESRLDACLVEREKYERRLAMIAITHPHLAGPDFVVEMKCRAGEMSIRPAGVRTNADSESPPPTGGTDLGR